MCPVSWSTSFAQYRHTGSPMHVVAPGHLLRLRKWQAQCKPAPGHGDHNDMINWDQLRSTEEWDVRAKCDICKIQVCHTSFLYVFAALHLPPFRYKTMAMDLPALVALRVLQSHQSISIPNVMRLVDVNLWIWGRWTITRSIGFLQVFGNNMKQPNFIKLWRSDEICNRVSNLGFILWCT